MKPLLKALGYLVALALFALICYLLTLYFQWEWWVGAALFLLLAGLTLGFGWIRQQLVSVLSRRRGEGTALPRPAAAAAPGNISELTAQWKKGIAALRGSGLSRRGDPLYALPWIAVIGSTGAGKTTALQRAHLASAIQETSLTGHAPATQTLEWWFFDRAVVLDVSGRYCSVEQDEGTQSEWKKLLSLIASGRRREPLNGLVVAIGADELLHGSPEKLTARVRSIRLRIDQLMRATGARFPVYVLVTKCDGLFGLDDWAAHLPPRSLNQALGYLHAGEAPEAKAFLDSAFASVDNRLRDLRLVITREVEHASAGLMLFPNEFERLRAPLESFIAVAFGEDPYTETPLLRGLFFSSAAQGGGVSSYVLKDTNLPDQTVMLMVKEQSLFLQDVFGRVIPQDRWLHQRLGRALQWERQAYRLGLAAWFLIAVGITGVLTASFLRSMNTVSDLQTAYRSVPELTGRLPQDVTTLSRHLDLLDQVNLRTSDWLTRLVPFNDDVRDIAQRLRESFLASFRKFVLGAIDERVARRVNPVAGPVEPAPSDLQFIVRRLNLVRAAGEGRSIADLARMPDPAPDVATFARVHGDLSPYDLTPEITRQFAHLYRRYLLWAADGPALAQERKRLENWLVQMTAIGESLAWLPQWANQQPGLHAVTLAEFWGGGARLDVTAAVPAGYTRNGAAAISGFLDEIQKSMTGGGFAQKRAAFEASYRAQRASQWLAFASAFEQGKLQLASDAEWTAVLERIGGERDPHVALLARIVSELADLKDEEAPGWLHLARRIETVRHLGRRDGLANEARRVTGVITGAGSQIARETADYGLARGKSLVDAQLSAGNVYGSYVAELQKAAKDALAGPGRAAQVAGAFHQAGDDPNVKDSALTAAHGELNKLRQLLGDGERDVRPVWELIGGSLTFLVQYAEQQAGCVLQSEWEKAVVAPLRGAATPRDADELLYGVKGAVWAFVEGPAKPFVRKAAEGYAAAQRLGFQPQFEEAFLPFLNRAAERQRELTVTTRSAEIGKERARVVEQQRELEAQGARQDLQKRLKEVESHIATLHQQRDKLRTVMYPVTVHALPTHANAGAKAHPHATLLTVQCAPEPRTITNYNFPVSATFNWTAQACGDVTLAIKIENLVLARTYPGARGMVAFATEFRDGERRFAADEFPGQRAALDTLAVKSISVRYQLGGHLPLLRQSDQLEEMAKKERELAEERRKLSARLDALEQFALREKGESLERQRSEIVEKERALIEPAPTDEDVPPRIALCWKPRPEWLLTKMPVREIPPPAPPRNPPEQQPTVGQGDFQIQLGAFGLKHTQRLLGALRRDKVGALVQKVDGIPEQWYRVRVGRYPTQEAAEQSLENLNARYRVSGAVFRYDPAFRPAGELDLEPPPGGERGLAPGAVSGSGTLAPR